MYTIIFIYRYLKLQITNLKLKLNIRSVKWLVKNQKIILCYTIFYSIFKFLILDR